MRYGTLSAFFGLFLYKKPRKRPVLQAVTSFFAGDVFEDEGFLVFVQSFELFFLLTMVASISNVFADENFVHKLIGKK